MRRRHILATLLVFGLGLMMGNAPLRAGEESGMDSVVGAGTRPISDPAHGDPVGAPQGNITVAAHSGPNGEFAFGTIRARRPGFTETTAIVECLLVEGNCAVAGGPIRTTRYSDDVEFVVVAVRDLGNQDEVQILHVWSANSVSACEFVWWLVFDMGWVPTYPIAHGNYTVTDAQE